MVLKVDSWEQEIKIVTIKILSKNLFIIILFLEIKLDEIQL
jgi:hypothetical protein